MTASTSKKRAYINLNADDRESSEDEQEPKNMNEPVANLDKSMFVEPQHSSSTASSSSGSSTELEIKKPPTPPNSRISSDAFVQTNASLNGTFAVPSGVPPKLFGPPQKRLYFFFSFKKVFLHSSTIISISFKETSHFSHRAFTRVRSPVCSTVLSL